MKKFYLFLLTLCLASVYSLPASAADDLDLFEINGIHYSLQGENKVYVINSFHYFPHQHNLIDETNYSWLSGDVIIPNRVDVADVAHAINGYQDVVGIEAFAFQNMTAHVSIQLLPNMKKIGNHAFYKAIGLERIFMNEGLTDLGEYAFSGCSSLTSVNIPTTLTYIPNYAFNRCYSLPYIYIPSSVTTIGYGAFMDCTQLESVNNGNLLYVEEIGEAAFEDCYNLQSINLSNSLVKIGSFAFKNCLALEKITLPRTLKEIGPWAFQGTGLKEVRTFSSTPQTIEASVFSGVNLLGCLLYVPKGCKEAYQNAPVWKKFGQILEEGERPSMEGVYRIGDLYYNLREDMTAMLIKHEINANHTGSLTIPASISFNNYGFNYTYTVNEMENDAFLDATGLTSVEWPATIDEIPTSTFARCSGLTKVTLPSSVRKIGSHAFYHCSALKDFTLPYNLREIDAWAFCGCESLTSLSIPAGVEILPSTCFGACTQLRNVWLHEGLKEIQDGAFNNCSALTTITLPESLSKIGTYAFVSTQLTSIKSLNKTPPTANDASFGTLPSSGCILYVPVGSKEAYEKAPGWKDFTDIREQGSTERIQVDGLYYQLKEDFTAEVTFEREVDNYSNIGSEVTVKDKVVYQGTEYKVNAVGANAFFNAVKITKVNLPKIMDEIGVNAFQNSNLREINIPATLRHLSYTAFEDTPLFANNMDEQHTVYYDGCLLYHEPSYTRGTFKVKEGTRLIASFAFCGAQADVSITELELPEGLQCICMGALDYMQSLETVNIPSSVYSIQDYFLTKYCLNLKNIYCYPQSPINISGLSHAFIYWTNEELAQINLYVPYGSKEAYSQADKWKDLSIVEMDPFYTVTFVDYDGRELDVQRVQKGKDATAPEEPVREGYSFTGWDKPLTNIQSDLTITAQYELKTFTVLFVDGYAGKDEVTPAPIDFDNINWEKVISEQHVTYGGSAIEPQAPKHKGYVFIGWDKEFDAITENTIVTAQYLEGDGVVTTVFHVAQQRLTYYYDKELVKTRVGITEVYNPSSSAPRFEGYSDNVLVIEIDPSMKKADLTSMNSLFYGGASTTDILSLRNVTRIIGLENLNTSIVTDMNGMFFLCQSMKTLDLSSFDTRNVKDMNGMFMGCNNLEVVDVSSFDISNVTDMRMMFAGCSNLKTICCSDDWSTSTAGSDYMFSVCNSLVGGQGTVFDGNVIDKTYARPDGGTSAPGYFTEKIEKVYTEFVEETGTLTYYYDDKITARTGVTEIYVPGSVRFTDYYEKVLKCVIDPSMKNAPITSMRGMFEGEFNTETFKVHFLTNMTSIEGLENLNTSIVTDMNSMFSGCESLTELDLSSFDTRNVTNMAYMFMSCTGLKIIDLNSFDISNATDMRGMFGSCWELTTICCSNDWSNCQADTYIMFSGCKKLVGDKGTAWDTNVIDGTYARPDGGVGAPGYFTADTMTGIKEMKNEERRIKNDIYNLSGQRLQKLQKGINIIGGRKILVK